MFLLLLFWKQTKKLIKQTIKQNNKNKKIKTNKQTNTHYKKTLQKDYRGKNTKVPNKKRVGDCDNLGPFRYSRNLLQTYRCTLTS